MSKPATQAKPAPAKGAVSPVWLGLLLAAATLIVYGRVASFEFTNYDDPMIILENPMMVGGLTLHGLRWALTTSYYEYWHPVMWLSHMLDCQLFGLRAGWHHLVSVGLHVANTLLLFVVLRRMTGALWRSALVAALFALHPLHVESVAWIAERKDVLSGLFFLLTLWAYARYAEQSVVTSQWSVASSQASKTPATDDGQRTTDYGPRNTQHAILYYLLCLFFYALGLMSKPMVMTLPFVLLLLDYWPLGRWQVENSESIIKKVLLLVREKLPFFALTVGSCAITYTWARNSGSLLTEEAEPWGLRLANVPVSYARYVGKLIWPTGLILPYPMPRHWEWWQVGGAVVVVAGITVWVARRARSAPYGVVGWLIFLGMLVPTIRLVHTGYQSIADRYTYLPSIGVFLAVVWGVGEWWERRLRAGLRIGLGCGVAGVGLLLYSCVTWEQVGVWRNGFTLWTHCLAVWPDNNLAHVNLGFALDKKGQLDEAIGQYKEALRLKPDYAPAHQDDIAYNNLGVDLARQGHLDEAMRQFLAALKITPGYADPHNNIGTTLEKQGRFDEAQAQFQEALRLKPDFADAHYNLGVSLGRKGRFKEAAQEFEQVLKLRPNHAEAHNNLGVMLEREGQLEEATRQYGEAARLKPDYANAHFNLGVALARQGRLEEAIKEFQAALRLKPDYATAQSNLSAALTMKQTLENKPGGSPKP